MFLFERFGIGKDVEKFPGKFWKILFLLLEAEVTKMPVEVDFGAWIEGGPEWNFDSKKLKGITLKFLPNFATNCKTMLSPATAHLTSKARSSHNTSQFNFDWKENKLEKKYFPQFITN